MRWKNSLNLRPPVASAITTEELGTTDLSVPLHVLLHDPHEELLSSNSSPFCDPSVSVSENSHRRFESVLWSQESCVFHSKDPQSSSPTTSRDVHLSDIAPSISEDTSPPDAVAQPVALLCTVASEDCTHTL